MKFAKTLSTRLVMLVLWTTIPLVALFLIGAVLMARDAVTQTTENLESSASLVAVNQQRQVLLARNVTALILLGANFAQDNRINNFEVRRIGRQRQVHSGAIELAVG